jgi:hypothetical protein
MNFSSEFSRTYNSFSGVDIQATFAGTHLSDLQGISYTVTREKGPLYTMGNPSPRAFSRGKFSCHVTVLKTGKAKSNGGYANPVAKLLFGDAVQTHA